MNGCSGLDWRPIVTSTPLDTVKAGGCWKTAVVSEPVDLGGGFAALASAARTARRKGTIEKSLSPMVQPGWPRRGDGSRPWLAGVWGGRLPVVFGRVGERTRWILSLLRTSGEPPADESVRLSSGHTVGWTIC
jgi:hypothetical protein